MVEITLPFIISILGLIIALISLILHWRRFKLEKPDISAMVIKKFYKVSKHPVDSISLSIYCLFENKGNAHGSVTDITLLLKPENKEHSVHKEPPLFQNAVFRPINFVDEIPIKVGPYGSEKAKFEFHVENINLDSIRRCRMPLNFFKPKKWSCEDSPLYFELVFKTTTGNIESGGCMFREDLEESNRVNGSFNVLEEVDFLHNK